MGMFDWLEFQGHEYQTKDTPRQLCDNYRIDELGKLWVEEYDAEWIKDPGHVFGAYIEQQNKRWTECEEFSGHVRFYREDKDRGGYHNSAWVEYEAEFKNGIMIGLKMTDGDKFLIWYQEAIEKKED